MWKTAAGFVASGHPGGMDTHQHQLLIAGFREDGSHSGCAYSRAVAQGRLLRLRRGVYVPTAAWIRSEPSDRHKLATAATALQLDEPVFCRETALQVHGLPC